MSVLALDSLWYNMLLLPYYTYYTKPAGEIRYSMLPYNLLHPYYIRPGWESRVQHVITILYL